MDCIGKAISVKEQCTNQAMRNVCNHYPEDPKRNYYGNIPSPNDIARSFIDVCNDSRYELWSK